MKTGVVIQARSSSTRLPEKVLKQLPWDSGITVLQQVIRRVGRSDRIDCVVVATSSEPEDHRIADIARGEGVQSYTGSLNDVLARFYHAARENGLELVLRVTADCPCIDPLHIDQAVDVFHASGGAYVSNMLEKTFMHGLDVEAFSFESLEEAYNDAVEGYDREHVTPYVKKIRPLRNFAADAESFAPDARITLDTPEDYVLLLLLYDYLYDTDNFFPSVEVVRILRKKPWLKAINQAIVQKRKITTLDDEVTEAVKVLELQGLKSAAAMLKSSRGP